MLRLLLVVLLREICNCLIRQACGYVNGTLIFEMIEADEARAAATLAPRRRLPLRAYVGNIISRANN